MEKKRKGGIVALIKYVLCGGAIGGGAILPGISGGVLCVVFGVYRPMMELFSHPFRAIKKNWKMFVPLGIGWLLGFWLFAKVVDILFQQAELYATWLFIGLIIGTIPALYKEAGKKGRTVGSFVSMTVCFAVLFAVLMYVKYGTFVEVVPNTGWFAFCGVLWGLSLVIPGMTSSSILMSLGLYKDMNAGIAALDMSVVIPWILGLVITAVIFAQGVNFLFEKKYSLAYHGVVGIVLASTLIIIPFHYESIWQLVIGLVCAAAGFALAIFTNAPEQNSKQEEENVK